MTDGGSSFFVVRFSKNEERKTSSETVFRAVAADALESDDRRNVIASLAGNLVPDPVIVAVPSVFAAERLFHDPRDAVLAGVVRRRREVPASEAFVKMRQEIERR